MAGTQVNLGEAAGLSYRDVRPDGDETGPPVLFVHGFPESSFMWNEMLPVAAAAGRRAVAPDLPGFGESPARPPTTWERLVDAVEEFAEALGLDRVVLVVHDWGGLVGLRWACDHPDRIAALVISDTGFFSDGQWHDMALTLRTEGAGEELIGSFDGDAFKTLMKTLSPKLSDEAIEHYWGALGTPEGQRAALDMYRSGDFEKLAPYEGRLGSLGVPTLVLWGENDPFAPTTGGRRFADEIPGARFHVVEGAGHFLFSDAPDECATQLSTFLNELGQD